MFFKETMKKTYIVPELKTQLIEMEGLIALSLQNSKADNTDALVKGSGDWDIFSEDSNGGDFED